MNANPLTAVLVASIASACVAGGDPVGSEEGSLTVRNDTRARITTLEVRLSNMVQADQPYFRDEIAGGLLPGEEVTFFGLGCNTFDLRLADELQARCQLRELDVCFRDPVLSIDDALLTACEAGLTEQPPGAGVPQ